MNRKLRRPSAHVQPEPGGDWREVPYTLPPTIRRAMVDMQDKILFCATCDARDPEYTACLLGRRPDLGPDMYERSIFGVCHACAERYNTEEIDHIVTARFGRRQGGTDGR